MGAIQRAGVVLDPLPLWLEALERVLNRIDIEVVGKAATYRSLDLTSNSIRIFSSRNSRRSDDNRSGSPSFGRKCERAPETKMIILSYHDDDEWIDGALGAGASAYVFKTAHPDDLASTIRQAFQSSVFVPGSRALPAAQVSSVENHSGLTRREIEILQLVSEGYSNAQVAKMLWVTQQTVKFHLSNIYRKLDVSNRTEASRWAQVNNMLPRMMPAVVRP